MTARRWTGSAGLHAQLTTVIRDREKVLSHLQERKNRMEASTSLVDLHAREKRLAHEIDVAERRLLSAQRLYDSKMVPYDDGDDQVRIPYKD